MSKDISIIIPMYNSETSIGKVLHSLDQQTARDRIFKVIVINDGSTDNSANEVRKFIESSDLPVVLINKENGGVSSARNLGMKNAGDVTWIAFCDADDLWMKNKLQRQLEIVSENSDIDLLGCAFSSEKFKIGFREITGLYKGSVKDICIKNFPQPSTVIMRKRIFDEIGGFDEKQRYAEDGNYFLKVAHYYNLYYLPEQLIEYGFGKRGFGVSGLSANLEGMYKGNIKNLKEMRDLKAIDSFFYSLMRGWHWIKYIRRVLISRG